MEVGRFLGGAASEYLLPRGRPAFSASATSLTPLHTLCAAWRWGGMASPPFRSFFLPSHPRFSPPVTCIPQRFG